MVSFNPDDMTSGVVLPVPGRYTWKDAKFVNDFDYGGQQEKQCAAQFILVNDTGEEFELNITVGKLEKLWPSQDGRTLEPVGASVHKSSNFHHFMERAINTGGFPKNRLSTNIWETFGGLTADFDGYVPPNRTAPLSVPVKFYLDGAVPAQAPTPATAPPAATTTAPPPPAPTAPAPNPAPAPAPTPGADLDMNAKGLQLAQAVLADPAMPNQRQAVNQLVVGDKDLSDEQRMAMMAHVFSDPFWAHLQANGVMLEG